MLVLKYRGHVSSNVWLQYGHFMGHRFVDAAPLGKEKS